MFFGMTNTTSVEIGVSVSSGSEFEEVKRYDEFVGWMRDIVDEGRTADQELSQAEREDLLDILETTPAGQEEAINLGLARRSMTSD